VFSEFTEIALFTGRGQFLQLPKTQWYNVIKFYEESCDFFFYAAQRAIFCANLVRRKSFKCSLEYTVKHSNQLKHFRHWWTKPLNHWTGMVNRKASVVAWLQLKNNSEYMALWGDDILQTVLCTLQPGRSENAGESQCTILLSIALEVTWWALSQWKGRKITSNYTLFWHSRTRRRSGRGGRLQSLQNFGQLRFFGQQEKCEQSQFLKMFSSFFFEKRTISCTSMQWYLLHRVQFSRAIIQYIASIEN